MSRRRFIETASMAALDSQLISTGHARASERVERPNILLIISDEHRASIAGCYGNKLARTPHLDDLASRGIVFDNCYTNAPLCVPSRLSMTSGKYSSRVNVWNNNCWLPSNDYPSIARLVNARGYESVLCGKMHYDATRNYGFTEIGPRNNAIKTGKDKRFAIDDATVDYQEWKSRETTFHAGDTSSILTHDRNVRDAAVKFLNSRTESDKPFFLIAGFVAPHYPLTVPEEYYSHYRGRIAGPTIPRGHLEMQPLNYQQLRYKFGLVNTDPASVIKGRECYYGLTEWCDHNIGTVISALRSNPALENTVVIYTTDHGENMGEHGLWWKNCMYETAAHIPLIVSWPQRWRQGSRRQQVCSSVDVIQTVAQATGATPPEDWNGESLFPLLDDSSHAWKNFAVSEYYAHNISSGFSMIRYGQYKYVYHTKPTRDFPAQRELYDLERDPEEFINVVSLPEHQDRISKLHMMMVKEIGQDPEENELRCRSEIAVGYNR